MASATDATANLNGRAVSGAAITIRQNGRTTFERLLAAPLRNYLILTTL
jgi:hypothetical protein